MSKKNSLKARKNYIEFLKRQEQQRLDKRKEV